jgi:hypothetical protein
MRIILTISCFSFSSLFAQTTVNFYGNPSTGNNGNAGTSTGTAKQTLKSLDTLVNASVIDTVIVNLAGNSTFSGTDGLYLNRSKVFVKSYNPSGSGNYNFPILKGADNFTTGWSLSGAAYTYSQNIHNSITISVNNYSFMYVVEVDTALERTAPYTARRYLTRVASQAAVESTPGSYYSPVSAVASPVVMYLHTSDGVSPNNHPSYRYEVVTRDGAVDRDLGGTFGNYLSVDKVIAMDYGQGTGSIASRLDSFRMTRSVIVGNTTHQGVYGMKSIIDRCLFMEGDLTLDGTAIVFYQVDGSPYPSTVSNSTFLDQGGVLYTHTSFGGGDGIHIGRINFHGNYVFNSRYKIIESVGYADTMDVNYLYTKDCKAIVSNNGAGVTYMNNVIAQNATHMIQYSTNTFITNSLYTSKTAQSAAIILGTNHKVDIRNSVFRFNSTHFSDGGAATILGDTSCRVTSLHNIYIINVSSTAATELGRANTFAGAGDGPDIYDYNAYVLVSGNPIWKVTNYSTNGGDPSVFTFSNWKIQSGQDAHSIMIDLRGNPNGVNQIFVNPDAGDYRLANTPQADSIRAISAGMSTPLRTFVTAPTREQAVEDIEQNRFTPVRNLFIPTPTSRRRIGSLNFTDQ